MSSMTSREWRSYADDASDMLLCLTDEKGQPNARATRRKFALIGVACMRRLTFLLKDEPSRRLIDLVERQADDRASAAEVTEARKAVDQAMKDRNAAGDEWGMAWRALSGLRLSAPFETTQYAAAAYAEADSSRRSWDDLHAAERKRQCAIVREIIGDPFRPVTLAPACRTPDVLNLARAIDAEAAFDRLPILGDALEEAGCAEAEILKHCRRKTGHVRGCWVVDLILDRRATGNE